MNMYQYINIIFYSTILALNLLRENESKIHKFYTNESNEFMHVVQFKDGNQFGEAAASFMPSEHSTNARQLGSEFNVYEQISQMSSKISEMCCKQDGMVVMVGVNPSYFDNKATAHTNSQTAFYMSKLQEKIKISQASDCVQNMKFNPKVGVVNVKFKPNSTYEQVNEVMNTMWSEENKVWFMEFDSPIDYLSVIGTDETNLTTPEFNISGRKLQTSIIPSPHPATSPMCPSPDFYGPYDYAAPNDSFFPRQWAMESANDYDVDATSFWNALSATPSPSFVAVIDRGLETEMSDFNGQLWENPGEIPNNGIDDDGNGFIDDYNGWNFYTNSSTITTIGTHGTTCSGIVAAKHNDGVGITGIAPSVKIVPLPTLYISDAASAIEYSIQMGFRVSSNSWSTGNTSYYGILSALIASFEAGQLYVTSVPNDSSDTNLKPSFPSQYNLPNMLIVGSTNIDGYVSRFSNYGAPYVHVFAPGECIYTTSDIGPSGDRYAYVHGTSFATPLVAGIAGELLAHFPNLTGQQVKQAIMDSCVSTAKFSTAHALCGGVVNAYNAYQYASQIA